MTVESSNRPAARPGPTPGAGGAAAAAGTMITVAPAGAEVDKSAVPGLAQRPPMTPDQARTMLGVPDRH